MIRNNASTKYCCPPPRHRCSTNSNARTRVDTFYEAAIAKHERRNPKDPIASLLDDPSLSVEDKLMLILMKVMEDFDRQIEKQLNTVRNLKVGSDNAKRQSRMQKTMDVEMFKLQQMTKTREQLFTMIREVMRNYNGTTDRLLQQFA